MPIGERQTKLWRKLYGKEHAYYSFTNAQNPSFDEIFSGCHMLYIYGYCIMMLMHPFKMQFLYGSTDQTSTIYCLKEYNYSPFPFSHHSVNIEDYYYYLKFIKLLF